MGFFRSNRNSTKKNRFKGIDSYGVGTDSESVQMETIIKAYDFTPVSYEYEDEFKRWMDTFLNVKEQELRGMNIDLDCFDLYVNEIKSQIMKETNSAGNQFYDHISSIRRIIRKLEGKRERFTSQKGYLEADLKKAEERLNELNDKKKALEGV